MKFDIDEAIVSLSKMDRDMRTFNCPPIATCTFFAGDFDQIRFRLRSKLLEVVRANPWLLGRFKNDTDHFVCPTKVPENSDDTLLDTFGLWLIDGDADKTDSRVSRTIPFPALCRAVVDSLGLMRVDDTFNAFKKMRPSSESSQLRCKMVRVNSEECAFLFGMSHSVADGHTYYKILNMLGPNQRVEAMEVRRALDGRRSHKDLSDVAEKITGKQACTYRHSFPFMKHLIWNNAWKKCPCPRQVGIWFVDEDKVSERKIKEVQGIANESANGEHCGVKFVSTNDIVTSDFAVACGADLLLMNLNTRKYISRVSPDSRPIFGDLDAGNYEEQILYDRLSFASPVEIRKSFLPKKDSLAIAMTSPNGIPGFWEKTQICVVSNWASFQLNLDGADAKTLLHLPCLAEDRGWFTPPWDRCSNPFPCDTAFIFNVTPERLAIMVYGKNIPLAALADKSNVFAGGVLEAGEVFTYE